VTSERFQKITGKFSKLSIAVVGDFCLDRYLEIDPARREISLETGLAVHNVVKVRAQPGGAGTILNNLSALGVGKVFPVGFAGEDGEAYELRRALAAQPGVCLDHFLQTDQRHTFMYCKPLVMEAGKAPRELNRLDQKNWTPTPASTVKRLRASVFELAEEVDAFAILSQVDEPQTGVCTKELLAAIKDVADAKPECVIAADSRHSLRGFPPVIFKMNAGELAELMGIARLTNLQSILFAASKLARRNDHPVFVTVAKRGIVGASPDGTTERVSALPLRGEIDVVGAGDAVLANLTAALAAGANLAEALELANTAASIVVHQLGTTGTASIAQLRKLMFGPAS
jgi:rfaE bifunctional protein kinase chain/domain